ATLSDPRNSIEMSLDATRTSACTTGASNFVPPRAAQQLLRPRDGFLFRLLARRTRRPCDSSAGRHIVGLAVKHAADLIAGQIHWPAIDLDSAFGEIFDVHAFAATGWAAPRSTGAPTRLPHSVQDPS